MWPRKVPVNLGGLQIHERTGEVLSVVVEMGIVFTNRMN